MKEEIRRYFIENFNRLVETDDIKETEARNERYEMMLNHYFDVVEKNRCRCFKTPEDILKEIDKSKNLIRDFIVSGKTL